MKLTHPVVLTAGLGVVLLGTFAWVEFGPRDSGPPRKVAIEVLDGESVELDVRADSPRDIEAGLKLLRVQERTWADAAALAEATPRMQLSAIIGNMQALARENADLADDLPACLKSAHAYFVDSQNATIDVFLAFMDSELRARLQVERNDPARAMRNYEMTKASCTSP